jgi:hypothetical protein
VDFFWPRGQLHAVNHDVPVLERAFEVSHQLPVAENALVLQPARLPAVVGHALQQTRAKGNESQYGDLARSGRKSGTGPKTRKLCQVELELIQQLRSSEEGARKFNMPKKQHTEEQIISERRTKCMLDVFAAQVEGVSSAVRFIGALAIPGRISARQSRSGTLSRRQLSIKERIAAKRLNAVRPVCS